MVLFAFLALTVHKTRRTNQEKRFGYEINAQCVRHNKRLCTVVDLSTSVLVSLIPHLMFAGLHNHSPLLMVLIYMVPTVYAPNFRLMFSIHLFLSAGVDCIPRLRGSCVYPENDTWDTLRRTTRECCTKVFQYKQPAIEKTAASTIKVHDGKVRCNTVDYYSFKIFSRL